MGEAVLEFRQVAVRSGHLYESAIWQVSFRLERGQLALVHLEESHLHIPLADAAQGLADAVQGSVLFLGRDWASYSHDEKLAARAKIGRVFDEPGWISELDMDENITLSQCIHTRRPESEIRDEASALSRLFSLPGLPQGKPSSMRAPAACRVRAGLARQAGIADSRATGSRRLSGDHARPDVRSAGGQVARSRGPVDH
jgi:ABC-type transporter Mla maintaining outer membrane lipid asymmetry ATPase subunit MlaF